MSVTIIHTTNTQSSVFESLLSVMPGKLVKRATHYRLLHHGQPDKNRIQEFCSLHGVDINTVPDGFNGADVGLLITDMDSTLISIECIDEIADFLNIKHKIAEITESAMRGEIDFTTSLTRRVSLLAGLKLDALEAVYRERLKLNPGAETLMSVLKSRGIMRALVSGGFTYFTDRLKQRLALDEVLSNTLEIKDNALTGKVLGDIVDGQAKAEFLRQIASQNNIRLQNCVAVGDGANDLPMMDIAGLSVAFRAKPKVQEKAKIILNYSGLDAILDILES